MRGGLLAQQPDRKHDDPADKLEYAFDRDAHDTERKQENPDDRIHDQS